MRKVIKGLILFMALLGTLVFAPQLEAKAGLTLAQLQAKFPNGAYWNHVVQSGHGYSNYQDYGPCNNPDGYTWSPCGSHNANVGIGGHDCNSFGNAMQCAGFAKKLAYDVYGSYCTSWSKTNINQIKPGDVLHYTGGGADAEYGHWVFVIGVNGNAITVGECNYGGHLCRIRWGNVIYKGNITPKSVYSAPYALNTSIAQTISWENDDCQPSYTDAYIYTRATPSASSTYTEAGVTVWDSKGNVVGTKTEYINITYAYLNIWYNLTADLGITLEEGTEYSYQFYAVCNGTRYTGPKKSFTTLGEKKPQYVNPFDDIYANDYYYDSVLWAVNKGITYGLTSDIFGPNEGCTRGQVVTFLWRAAGSPKPSVTSCKFVDVAKNAYYYDAVLWAVEKGITGGLTNTVFAPEAKCTRGQIVSFLWRAAGSPEPSVTSCKFTDVAKSAYYYKPVLWAAKEGITGGWTETLFAPEMECTRGQVVTFLYRYYN